MIKCSQIDLQNVSGAQIGRCHKIVDQDGTPAWMVESESDATIEYKVKHSKEHGFTCTCKSGTCGFSNTKDGICKHVRWSCAAEKELREAMAELEAAIALDKVMSDQETIKAAEIAREAPDKVARKRATAPIERKAFSILR